MSKKAKIYCINLGGHFKNIKAYSKKQIAESLKITMNDINFDCQLFTLEDWEDDNIIDIDLTDDNKVISFTIDFKEALKLCIDGRHIQNIAHPKSYFLRFNGKGFEDSSNIELDTYDFCELENKWRVI